MSGVEVVVGFLIAWVARRAGHVGDRIDEMADNALDAGLGRLRALVGTKLRDDPALAALEHQASTRDGDVRATTRERVRLALADAVEDDPDFAAALDKAVADLRNVASPNGHGEIHQKIASMSHSNAIGAISGGYVHIDQSQTRGNEACFCGLHANATCPRCGTEVCANHYFVVAAEALRYPAIASSGGPDFRAQPAYPALFAAGGAGCVRCRFRDADAEVDETRGFVARWLAHPRQLSEQDVDRLSRFPTMLPPDSYQPMLASMFHLFEPNENVLVTTVSATRPEQTRRQRKDFEWPPWQVTVTVELGMRAFRVPNTTTIVTETGELYVPTGRPALNAQGATVLAVPPGVIPELRNVPVAKRWTPKTGPEFFQEDWQPVVGEVVRQVSVSDLPDQRVTVLFQNLRR